MTPASSIARRAIPTALLLLAFTVAPALARRMDVEVWTDRGDDAVYEPGDEMRVNVRTSDDAYLLVYEIDSQGNVNLLYPWRRGASQVEGRRTLQLPGRDSDYQLVVEKETGQGFVVAIASDQPFRDLPWYLRPFDPQAASMGYEGDPDDADNEGFDERGHVVGDPYVAMERIRRRVLEQPGDLNEFASAYTTYYVHEQVRYPRYICNDCHRPSQWAWWDGFDPYYTHCSVVDFRVNWGWCWGPSIWTSYVPYYYYVMRSDCPPRYQRWYDNRSRFSSWDGHRRWGDLWGGQLRRIKPSPAPIGYVPPAPHGTMWRNGQTPPGFVPPDVRRQGRGPSSSPTGWLGRDRGDGRPVWRDPRPSGGSSGSGGFNWRDPNSRPGGGGNTSAPPTEGRGRGEWWQPRGGSSPSSPPPSGGSNGAEEPRPRWGPRNDPPRNDPPPAPRNDPPRNDPPRREPMQWRQPPPPPPPHDNGGQRTPPPPQQKNDPPRGQSGKWWRG